MMRGLKLQDLKEEVIAMWNEGASVDDVATYFRVSPRTAKESLKLWGVYEERLREEPKMTVFAKPKRHTNEVVMVKGKPMLDVTDYIVDCGG